jgi:hypothetical protein
MHEPHDLERTADEVPSAPPDPLDAGLAAGFGRPADGPDREDVAEAGGEFFGMLHGRPFPRTAAGLTLRRAAVATPGPP